ncbi:6-carboxytetrahydropterin synthase [Halorubrum sp. 2020YC2]|uniref:6-carboxytetrahydropterin synthase n=1 Tax=Halorubrum sp. 2020YC2 TaxID=2836432 RepID=UPI001BE55AEF|nr:6-carboxytetrahydropterin synthase [Halorubrum sp. 2020YC2]QWC18177.1 6-carboxytetrahydropterin synthase [Halorubrum sp. 2020YC2]
MVKREFIAQHFLTVPDPEPPEGDVHSHRFTVEVEFAADSLAEYGYLVNINEVESLLDDIEGRYRDALLNDLPEFEGLNPSVERFARIVCDRFREALSGDNPDEVTVRIWEDDLAWASYRTAI